MPTKSEKKKQLRSAIIKAFGIKERYKFLSEEYKEDTRVLSEKINGLMKDFGVTSCSFVLDEDDCKQSRQFTKARNRIVCKKITPKKIEYDAKSLYGRLGKEVGSQVVKKEYVITDIDGLIKLLKSSGVKPKQFKRFVETRMTVDTKSLDKLYETGIVNIDDLVGCYTIKSSNSYFSITSKPEEQGDTDCR